MAKVEAALAEPPPGEDIGRRMDRMYRPQKLFYDLTRKYYLIGRDRLVDRMGAAAGAHVLDLGCGTGRNLARMAARYPDALLYGLDAAAPMLEVAAHRLGRAQARLARGDAERFEAERSFGVRAGFDHIAVSYALSMMDRPTAALDNALRQLVAGGRLHIVDFGDMAGLPRPAAALLQAWLKGFHVRHRPEVERHLTALAAAGAGTLEVERLLGGYAILLRFTKA